MNRNRAAIIGVSTFVLGLTFMSCFAALVLAQLEARSGRGTPYLSGGIGLDERDALRSRATDYNLMLSFAEKAGNYLSDVEVVMKDAQGNTVLAAVSAGPWFFAKLPPVRYTVLATTMGKTNQQGVHVKATGQPQLYFYW